MSKLGEHKRVSLTTISTQRSIFNSNEAGFSSMPPTFSRFGDFLDPDAVQPNKSSKSANKSVRLQLELFETDSNRYPEFNYSKLLYLEKKKAKMLKGKTNNGSTDPFADNDDDVARIAKELEAKYGNAYARGRGRRKKDDFCDIGMGYDESDSFIDNTEAYDEILPEEVETLEGGFYINCGALEFKNLNKKSSTRRTDAIIKMPERSRKRVVSSSSDDSSESSSDSASDNEQKEVANNKVNNNNNDDEDDNDDDEDEDDGEDDDDEDDDDEDDDSDSDSESIDGSDSDTESLGDETSGTSANTKNKFKQTALKRPKPSSAIKQKVNNNGKKPSSKLYVAPSSSSNSPRPNAIDISDTEERQSQALKKVVKTTTVKDMLKAKRDSFLKSQGQLEGPSKITVNGEVKCTTSTTVDSSSDNDDTDSASEQGRSEKLPKTKDGSDNLRPADTILPATLDNDMLASINCFKELVRSRDLCGKRFYFDGKLTALLLKVYEALLCTERNERNMVFAHLEYQLQLPKYFILRKAKALRAREEKNKTTNALERLRKAVAEVMPKAIANYEIELHKFAELAAADVNAEHPPKMPRKKFQWTNELRERLYEVYQARWTSYAVLGKRKDSLEQFINGYLKDKIVDVWATGWMRYEELQREIERHKHASKKLKEKAKKQLTAIATTAPTANNYLKQLDELTATEQSRSRANSDTDSATSASSNSVKRKLELPPSVAAATTTIQQKPSAKPPKIKFQKQLAATLAQMSQINNASQMAPVAIETMSLPAVNNYLKQFDELTVTASQSRSRANSDTDSVKSASSTSLKRKLEKPTMGGSTLHSKQCSKPPKKKKQQPSPTPMTQLDTLMSQPSTSQQAAALNAAVVAAAASMLELASPTKTEHGIYNMITAASLNAASASVSAPINSQSPSALHSTTSVVAARPVPHVINLDDYKSPSDILQTSQQLAATEWQPVQVSPAQPPPPVPPAVVRCESSSESDGVEIVGVYPAVVKHINPGHTKPRSKANQKSKTTSVISTTGTVPNGLNGAVGFNLDNMYIYNNNNAAVKIGPGVIRANAASNTTSTVGYDLSRNPQIMKQLSDLSALEKQMKWSKCSLLSAGLKGAGTGAGSGAGAGAGASTHQ
ncbi:yemanuclein [Drosophila montana]|uniref:yemanuclein n=1 Tax=Drosophila montana TaxID=40370 RepID=UPI00313E0D1C